MSWISADSSTLGWETLGVSSIQGHPLPDLLIRLIGRGLWVAPSLEHLAAVFGDRPTAPRFYDQRGIAGETESWVHETDPAYLGEPPDDLDPANSVLVGDLGPDQPFALDYRTSPPCVRYLGIEGGWRVVAVSIDALAHALDLAE